MKRSTKRGLLRARDQMQDHLGVGGRLHDGAVVHEFAPQRQAVGEIAVMADGKAERIELGEERLHVAQQCLAGGRIADMAAGRIMPGRRSITWRLEKVSPTRPSRRSE